MDRDDIKLFESMEKAYNNGIYAVANFIYSQLSFENWWREGPYEIPIGWRHLLESLGREQEYWDLKNKLDKKLQELERN